MSIADDPTYAALEVRVRQLEAEVLALRNAFVPASPPPPTWILQPPPPTGPPLGTARQATPARRPAPTTVDSETILKWGGIALVVLAIGFALSTAISRGWIGPQLQLAGAVALSAALIAGGLRLRPRRMPWTHALCTGGVLGLFTTIASNLFLDHVDETVASALAVCIAVGAYGLARLVPSEWVGAAALSGGTLAWLAINHEDLSTRTTVAWITLLAVSAVALSLERRWTLLRISGQIVGLLGVLGVAHLAANPGDRTFVLTAGAIVAAMVLWVPTIKSERPAWSSVEFSLPTLLGPWALAVSVLVFEIDDRRPAGLLALGVGAATAAAAIAWRRQGAHAVAIGVGASVAISVGLGLVFDGETAALTFALQGVGLIELGHRVGRRSVLVGKGALLAGVGALITLGRTIDAWTIDATVVNDIVHLATIVAAFVAAWLLRRRDVRPMAALGLLAAMLLWIGSVLVHLPQGQAAVSIAWAIVGTAVLVVGATRKIAGMAAAGLGVLGLTVGKLLTVDLAQVDTLWRAGLFLLVGFVLLRLGFLLPRLTKDDAKATTDAQ